MKKYFEKRKLVKFLDNLTINDLTCPLPLGYMIYHKNEIDMIKWIIGYYENRTASKPIEFFGNR